MSTCRHCLTTRPTDVDKCLRHEEQMSTSVDKCIDNGRQVLTNVYTLVDQYRQMYIHWSTNVNTLVERMLSPNWFFTE